MYAMQKNISIWQWGLLPQLHGLTSSLKNYTLNSFKMLILLVEDDLDRMRELKKCFESKTVKVITADGMTNALKLLRGGEFNFDRIYSDVNLPYGSGFALIEEIKKDSTIKYTPFYMYSSKYIDRDNRNLAIDFGVDHCIFATEPTDIINETLN